MGNGLPISCSVLKIVSVKLSVGPYDFFLFTLYRHTTFKVKRCYSWNMKINGHLLYLKADGSLWAQDGDYTDFTEVLLILYYLKTIF